MTTQLPGNSEPNRPAIGTGVPTIPNQVSTLPKSALVSPESPPVDKPKPRKRSGTRKRKKNPGVGTRLRTGLSDGFEGAKADGQTALSGAVRSGLGTLFNMVIEKGVGAVMNGKLLSGIGGQAEENPSETPWPEYFMRIITGEYGVITVIGSRDSGKTTVAVEVAETRQRVLKSNIYFLNYPPEMAPENITPVHGDRLGELMELAEPGSTIIVDDASLVVNSKRQGTDEGIAFESLINTIAHRGILLIITVQDTSDMNKSGLRADAYLIKPPERMFIATERPRMQIIMSIAAKHFDTIPQDEWLKYIFIWVAEDRMGLVKYNKPEWMDRAHAKYRGFIQQQNAGKQPGVNGASTNGAKGGKASSDDEYPSPFEDESSYII